MIDPKSVQKAQSRIRIAKQQLQNASDSADYEAFSDSWYLFLTAAKNVYTLLEQGAKASAQGRQWFGGKKAQRKTDPLLQYLFQARNDDEHGLADVTKLEPGHLAVGKAAPGGSQKMRIDIKNGVIQAQSLDGLPVLFENAPPHPILITVTGMGNVKFDPPTEHLGMPLENTSPVAVGGLAMAYLEKLVEEANGLST